MIDQTTAADLRAKTKEADSFLDTPCWEWQGNISPGGYGRMYVDGTLVNVHRYAYSVFTGEDIPEGLVVRHICHNKGCINPVHLKLGTQADNMRDSIRARSAIRRLGLDSDPIRLSKSIAEAIRTDNRPQTAIGEEYGIGPNQVSRIRRGKVWRATA